MIKFRELKAITGDTKYRIMIINFPSTIRFLKEFMGNRCPVNISDVNNWEELKKFSGFIESQEMAVGGDFLSVNIESRRNIDYSFDDWAVAYLRPCDFHEMLIGLIYEN